MTPASLLCPGGILGAITPMTRLMLATEKGCADMYEAKVVELASIRKTTV
jgi:hypothetical protein